MSLSCSSPDFGRQVAMLMPGRIESWASACAVRVNDHSLGVSCSWCCFGLWRWVRWPLPPGVQKSWYPDAVALEWVRWSIPSGVQKSNSAALLVTCLDSALDFSEFAERTITRIRGYCILFWVGPNLPTFAGDLNRDSYFCCSWVNGVLSYVTVYSTLMSMKLFWALDSGYWLHPGILYRGSS